MNKKQILRSKTSLNLAVWNINDLKSKLINKFNDNYFLNSIKYYDIIGLVETHLVESLPSPLRNLTIYHFHRSQNAKAILEE